MGLLQRHGVQPVQAEQLLAPILAESRAAGFHRVEAKLALTTVKTIEGASLIANQVKAGLGREGPAMAGSTSIPRPSNRSRPKRSRF